MNAATRDRKNAAAVRVGLIANIILAMVKTFIGIVGTSPALLADGINSTSDTVYYVIVSIFMRMARKPPDEEHPYGHRQMENIAAIAVGAFVITTAVAVFWDAVNDIYNLFAGESDFQGASISALIVALVTVFIKLALTVYTRRIGKQTKSAAISALAYDHRNDIFSALAATIGIFLSRLGFLWVDPLAGALVALVILRTGIEILRESSTDLMNPAPGKELLNQIDAALNGISEIQAIEDVRVHRFGPYLALNLTICVDGALTVAEGDAIATRAEKILYANIDMVRSVHIHYHPRHGAECAYPSDAVPADEVATPSQPVLN